jgi:DNA invertase Pin-like site-specific DNA recombinase
MTDLPHAGLAFNFRRVTLVFDMNTRRARPGSSRLAVAYLRASTEEQKLGPEAQRAAIELWAAREGVEVAAWHVDAGVSGGSALDARPALGAALAALRGIGAGVLVIARRDRLARDVAIAAAIEKATIAAGAKVISADGSGNGDGPADSFMRTLLDGTAAYERALIRARTKAALAAKRARGERAGGVPYGFTADDAGRLSPCPVEQVVIAVVADLRAAGMPLRAIVAELACRGLVSRTGRALQLMQVARMAKGAAA